MYEMSITYKDYNEVERTETFRFNFNKTEIATLEYGSKESLTKKLQRIIDSKDNVEIMETFKKLIQDSYGVKSEDGKRFIKSKELTEAFTQTEAYVEIFMKLANDSEAAALFVNGIIPQS